MKTAFFYPSKPKEWNRIMWVIQKGGYNLNKLFYWSLQTVGTFDDKGEGINRHVRDVSKSNVEKHFKKAFGYGTFLSPNGKGKAVVKCEKQAAHSGRVVKLPTKLEDGHICQRLIDAGGVEYRVLIIYSQAKCVLVKHKSNGFGGGADKFETKKLSEVFGKSTVEKINTFAESMQIDYAEIDVLRDLKTKKNYIIDVNPCVGGGTKEFFAQTKEELTYFAEMHKELFN